MIHLVRLFKKKHHPAIGIYSNMDQVLGGWGCRGKGDLLDQRPQIPAGGISDTYVLQSSVSATVHGIDGRNDCIGWGCRSTHRLPAIKAISETRVTKPFTPITFSSIQSKT